MDLPPMNKPITMSDCSISIKQIKITNPTHLTVDVDMHLLNYSRL